MASSSFRNGAYRGYEIGLRVRRRGVNQEPYRIRTPEGLYHFMGPELSSESSEHMDARNQVTGVYLVGKGGCNGTHVDPKEFYKAALVSNSSAFMMVHNHPSGSPDPSVEDMAVTERVREGSKLLGLEVLDHVIVGNWRYFSFREHGLLGK